MFGLGMPELIVILVIVIVIFGGSKLPELGESLGKGLKSFRKGVADIEESGKNITEEIPGIKEAAEIKEKIDEVKNLGKVTKIIK